MTMSINQNPALNKLFASDSGLPNQQQEGYIAIVFSSGISVSALHLE
jgi:hypothetical protein